MSSLEENERKAKKQRKYVFRFQKVFNKIDLGIHPASERARSEEAKRPEIHEIWNNPS